MFMQRIDAPPIVEAKPRRRGLKLVVGSLFLLVGLVVMLPWTVALALGIAIVVAAKAVVRAATFVHDTLLYAGEIVLGR